ncbi:protein kinase domain-containing protein [Streptomyces sp. BE303]|uniref:protein kinase domain-containing protein n=1 Tax=Streptomyces sp. BE303 TaxID=3002528 RepID=UPI002E7A9E26|nr:hypothetical protein [Streptomyces sp. BE303]MED7953025.1 hypothetical protein [Streptomyces sp. BE303]
MADTPPEPSPPTRKQGRGQGTGQGTGQGANQARGGGRNQSQGQNQGRNQGQGQGRTPAQGRSGDGPTAASPPTRVQRSGGPANDGRTGTEGGGAPAGHRSDTPTGTPTNPRSGTPQGAPAASPPTRVQGGSRPRRTGNGTGGTTGATTGSTDGAPTGGGTPAAGSAVPSPATRLQRGKPPAPAPARTPAPGAPTRVQRPGATQPPPAPGGSASPTAAPSAGPSADQAGAFPTALTDRYHPVGPAGSGSEGTVWHVRRADGGGDAAVKVGNPGVQADTELLTHLGDAAFRRHVPEILGHGRIEHAGALCDWMAMEYLPVTLADHVAELRRRGRLDRPGETERIIRELVALLDFWQTTVDRNPVDFKPANILVREGGRSGRGGPAAPQFVVADFGGVAKLTASRRFSADMQVTVAFMAPEQLAGHNHRAGPWWALGTILYEVFTGGTRYRRADGGLVSDEALQYRLVMEDVVDLAAVTDERRRLLLQGLFTKEPADRWTAPQVRDWLAGGSPEVVRTRVAPEAPQVETGPAYRPIAYRGADFHDPTALAVRMLAESGDAAAWLMSGGARRLRDWLRDEVKDTALDLHYLKDVDRGTPADRSRAASRAVLALGAVFAPEAVPHVRDRRVDATGLARTAGEDGTAAFVDELIAAGLPALAARFRCGHEACPDGACRRLLALTELPAVLEAVGREARDLGGRGGGRGGGGRDGRLTADELATAHRWALLLTVQPDAQRLAVVRRVSALPGPLRRLPAPAHTAATVVADTAGTARAAVLRGERDRFRRAWSELRRRALAASPTTAEGRALLAAAAVLHVRRVRAEGARRGADRGAWKTTARAWGRGARSAVPRRAAAAVLLLLGLAVTLWAGAVWRIAVDAGAGGAFLPDGAFGGPLRTAGDTAARETVGQLGAALVAAVAVAAFPARIGRRVLLLVVAAAFAVGYLRLGPPMTVLRPPAAVVERVVMFEGGLGSWAGVGAAAGVVLALVLNGRSNRWLLNPANEAEERAAGDRRRLAARRRARGGSPNRWRTGRAGLRDRLLFALGGTLVLTLLLWAAVEVRLVVGQPHHPTPESWGTGQAGAAYQADYLLLLAFLALLGAVAVPRTAPRILAGSALGVVVLGAWPPPLGPLEALRIPVLGSWFSSIAEVWGHAAFWAALLVALPLACYVGFWTVRRVAE